MDKGDADHGQRLWLRLGLGLTAGVVAGLTGWRRWKASQTSPLIRKGEHLSALVTGASSGIGRAYATKLAAQGYDVILVARRLERLTSLAQALSDRYGVAATVVSADLATNDGISRVESVIEDTEHLNLLVNNAGFGLVGDFAQSDIERHLEMLHVHIHAVVRLTRAALPMLLAQNRGAVINVSSLMAYYPMYGSTTYAGTKCYLRAFTEALHQELIGTGVRVQSLCP
ncbi:MAG: SDR family NAD(P)-dependent oxidoreductase, partial [Anaerolineae bacterium]